MAYTFDEPRLGLLQIAQIDAGITTAQSTSDTSITTKIPTPPNTLGMVVRAFDPTYGEGEFILLKGVASTTVGSVVVWDGTTYATTLAPATANTARPVAISMAANTAATTFSWYQIGGTAIAARTTGAKLSPTVAIGVTSVGKVAASSTGKEIEGARSANAATVASATTTVAIVIDRPAMQGRIT
jgi:hypothetical protein